MSKTKPKKPIFFYGSDTYINLVDYLREKHKLWYKRSHGEGIVHYEKGTEEYNRETNYACGKAGGFYDVLNYLGEEGFPKKKKKVKQPKTQH